MHARLCAYLSSFSSQLYLLCHCERDCRADYVFLMPGESAAIVLDSDNTADSFVLPVQTQTALTICFGALIMHVTMPRERKKKGKPGEY